jgi:hypothetical protein
MEGLAYFFEEQDSDDGRNSEKEGIEHARQSKWIIPNPLKVKDGSLSKVIGECFGGVRQNATQYYNDVSNDE